MKTQTQTQTQKIEISRFVFWALILLSYTALPEHRKMAGLAFDIVAVGGNISMFSDIKNEKVRLYTYLVLKTWVAIHAIYTTYQLVIVPRL